VQQKEDVALLNGSCSHVLHLRCWREAGSCCAPPADAVNMEDDLSDPLRIMAGTPPAQAAAAAPTMNPFAGVLSSLGRLLDDAVETTGASLARRKAPVSEFLSKGFNALGLVAKEPVIVPILVLEGEYSAQQMQGLGFVWATLLQGGLTEQNFTSIYAKLGVSLLTTFVGGLADLLVLCSDDLAQLPRLGITAADLGTKVSAGDLFEAGLTDRTLLEFGFTVEEWASALKLADARVAKLSVPTLRLFVNNDPEQKIAFDHFFPRRTFVLAPDFQDEDEDEDPITPPVPQPRTQRIFEPKAVHLRPEWRIPAAAMSRMRHPPRKPFSTS